MSIPRMRNLIIGADEDDHEVIKKAADNLLVPILDGIAGIGHLIWHGLANATEPAESHHMQSVAVLLVELADWATELRYLESNAVFALRELEKRTPAKAAQP